MNMSFSFSFGLFIVDLCTMIRPFFWPALHLQCDSWLASPVYDLVLSYNIKSKDRFGNKPYFLPYFRTAHICTLPLLRSSDINPLTEESQNRGVH